VALLKKAGVTADKNTWSRRPGILAADGGHTGEAGGRTVGQVRSVARRARSGR
jgi:hypothetical protein